MALIKEKETDFGVTANYWRLEMVSIDRRMQEASFSLRLYLNKDAKQYIESYAVTSLMGTDDKTLYKKYFEEFEDGNKFTDIYNACYEYTKKYEEYFKDAIDG